MTTTRRGDTPTKLLTITAPRQPTPMSDDITVRIDWEKQTTEQVTVFYMAGPYSGTVAFMVGAELKADASEKEMALAAAQDGLVDALGPLLNTLRGIVMEAPSFRGKPVGDPPALFRAIVKETVVKDGAVTNGKIVDVVNRSVEALWGEPSAPVRYHLGGTDLDEVLEMALDAARELAEAHIG